MGLLFPPAIVFLNFKDKEELHSMPITEENHECQQENESQDSDDDERVTSFSRNDDQDQQGSDIELRYNLQN